MNTLHTPLRPINPSAPLDATWTQHPKPFSSNPPRTRLSKRRRRPKRRRQRSPKRRRRRRSRPKRRRLRPKRQRLPPPKSRCHAAHALPATSARRRQQPIQNQRCLMDTTIPIEIITSAAASVPAPSHTTHVKDLILLFIFTLHDDHFCPNASSDQQTSI